MKMNYALLAVSILACAGLVGCTTVSNEHPNPGLAQAQAPAWSYKARSEEMVIAVSPAGKAFRLAGSSGMLVGAVVDANVNEGYARKVKELLNGYDTGKVFEDRLASRMTSALGQELKRVEPLTSTAGFQQRRNAQDARFESLVKSGADQVLDLNITYGLYGPDGIMAARITGSLYALPKGRALWRDTVYVASGPVFADTKLGDPIEGSLFPDLSQGLGVHESAMQAWLGGDGSILKERFEQATDGVISALLCDLGLAEEAKGEYALGCVAMNRQDFQRAEEHFAKALRLEPSYTDAQNARAVNLAHSGNVDGAITAARAIASASPEYGPAWLNLAYWHIEMKKDIAQGKECYNHARACGMPQRPELERKLEQ